MIGIDLFRFDIVQFGGEFGRGYDGMEWNGMENGKQDIYDFDAQISNTPGNTNALMDAQNMSLPRWLGAIYLQWLLSCYQIQPPRNQILRSLLSDSRSNLPRIVISVACRLVLLLASPIDSATPDPST